MSLYEIVVSTVAVTNLALTLLVMQANKTKATASKLEELRGGIEADFKDLERRIDRRVNEQGMRIERMDANANGAPSHKDLSAIYAQLNETRQQVERLSGEVEQMNSNVRMVLTQLMKTL